MADTVANTNGVFCHAHLHTWQNQPLKLLAILLGYGLGTPVAGKIGMVSFAKLSCSVSSTVLPNRVGGEWGASTAWLTIPVYSSKEVGPCHWKQLKRFNNLRPNAIYLLTRNQNTRRIWVGGLNPKHKKYDIESEVLNKAGAFKTYSFILERKYCYKMPTRDKVSSICIP